MFDTDKETELEYDVSPLKNPSFIMLNLFVKFGKSEFFSLATAKNTISKFDKNDKSLKTWN